MGRKNAFLTQIQAKKEKDVHDTSIRMANWTQQAAYDALVMTLGYDNVVYGRNMGTESIDKVATAWAKNLMYVMKGMGMETDADFHRAKTDEKVKAKVPAEIYVPWEQRYVEWLAQTTEEEAKRLRKYWEKNGYNLKPAEEV